jgi:hypothetical protein
MAIPDVHFVPAEDSPTNPENKYSLRQLGLSTSQVEDLCALATHTYRGVLGRQLPDILLEHAPREVTLGGFVRPQNIGQSGAAAYVESNSYRLRQVNGRTEVPLKSEPITMRLGLSPADLLNADTQEHITNFLTHESIHLATRQAISSLMRGPEEAMAMGLERYVRPKHDDQLTTIGTWGWRRELSRSTDGLCPPDFQDIDFYNQTIEALYIAAATAFQDESEEQLWAFAAKLTEVALRKNAAPVKAEIEQAVRDVFPKTADAILRSPAFRQIAKEGLQLYWVSNAQKNTAVFYPYVQQKIAAGSSRNALATFALRPATARFANTFYGKQRTPMAKNIRGGGELISGELHTVESIRGKMRGSGNTNAINLANAMGGVSIQVPGTSHTVDLFG